MLAKFVTLLVACGSLACSGRDEQSGATGDKSRFYPKGVTAAQRLGNNSVFTLSAFSLIPGRNGLDLFASLENAGDVVACNTSFSLELLDPDDQVVAAGVSGLAARRYYRFADDAGTLAGAIAGCLAPGDSTKVAVEGLTLDPPSAEVRRVVYQTNSWSNLDLVAIAGVSLSGVSAVKLASGIAYAGSLLNGLDTALEGPTVAVYPVNAVGRPLGVAYGGSSLSLSPGAKWDFETSTVEDPGVAFDAYPMGGP